MFKVYLFYELVINYLSKERNFFWSQIATKNKYIEIAERFCFKLIDKEKGIFLVENFDQKNKYIETPGGKYFLRSKFSTLELK